MLEKIGDVCSEKTVPTVIPHVVNDCGVMGSGVALALYKKYPDVKKSYLDWYNGKIHPSENKKSYETHFRLKLGQIQIIEVEKDLHVCNMVAQAQPGGEYIYGRKIEPIRYQSLQECMLRLADFYLWYKKKNKIDFNIDAPWFGTDRAGGSKEVIKSIIEDVWQDFNVTMFSFEE